MKAVPGENTPEALAGSNAEPTDDGTDFDPGPLPLSEVFEVLRNTRRRRVLHVLRDQGGSSTLSEVAESIAAWENDKDVRELTSSERKRVYVGLYQCHLPKMADAGIVTFDKHRGDVEFGPGASRVFDHLDVERARPWPRYYLALAGLWSGVLLLGASAGLSALTSPPVLALQVLTFLLCAVAHCYDAGGADGGAPSWVDDMTTDAGG